MRRNPLFLGQSHRNATPSTSFAPGAVSTRDVPRHKLQNAKIDNAKILLGSLLAVLAFCGCGRVSNPEIAKLEAQVEKLEDQLRVLQFGQTFDTTNNWSRFYDLGEEIKAVGLRLDDIGVEKHNARLQAAANAFQTAHALNGHGYFFFAIADVTPFLDGHKVTVRIGNPQNCSFDGFKLYVSSGERKTGFRDHGEFTFTETLNRGAWTMVDFILKETKPGDVAQISIAIATSKISLYAPSK